MNRTEPLAQWAKLAPGECGPVGKNWFNLRFDGQIRYVGLPLKAKSLAVLLSALIESIRARGWHYNLFSDETESGNEYPGAWHTASIYRTAEHVVPKTIAQQAEPCDALLDAYVAALQQWQPENIGHDLGIQKPSET